MDRLITIFLASFGEILIAGFKVTLPLAFFSAIFGTVIAVITALLRMSSNKILSGIAKFYVWIIRGTPIILQLYIIYFGLPSLGIVLTPWPAGIMSFSIMFGAYASEIIRGAFLSVPAGQIDAARSLGMTKGQIVQRTIIPQATRIALPSLMNQFISLTKQTSLASALTLQDIFLTGKRYISVYYETFLIYIEVALVYLLFVTVLTYFQKKIEKRLSIYT